jgi:hypothetical protein
MIDFFNFVQLSSAKADNNTDPVVTWWWLRRREKRCQGKIKRGVHPFFRDILNSGAYIVSKELNQDPDSAVS